MIEHRQRGFINFYSIFIGLVAVALLLVLAEVSVWIPHIGLLSYINMGPYTLAVIVGVLAAGGSMRKEAFRLHAMPLGATASLALKQTAIVAACVFALMFVTKDRAVSRLFLGSYLVLFWFLLIFLHSWVPRFFARMLFADRSRTLFVGHRTTPVDLLRWSRQRAHLGVEIVGYLADQETPEEMIKGIPFLGKTDSLQQVLQHKNIHQVILLDWLDDQEEMERIVETCEEEGCRFMIHNRFATNFARNLIGSEEGGQHFFVMQEEPLEDPVARAIKRTLDIVVSLPIVVLIIPPLSLMVWLAHRIQAPGPLMFVRLRGGKHRKEFSMLKFRSMYVGNLDVAEQATTDDERVFPLGRFLRKSSLDEFPQFINVLTGEMSLVGPRPHLSEHDQAFSRIDPTYRMRSLVKPGITGLAQIRGFRGGITDPEKLHRRVYWDLYYSANWSVWSDIRIILITAWQMVFPHKSAY